MTAVVLITLALLMTGCLPGRPIDDGGGNDGISVEWTFDPLRPRIGPSQVYLKIHDKKKRSLEGADLQLEGNMTHPGMVPVYSKFQEISPGRYSADFSFTMAGEWILFLTGKLADGKKLEKQFILPSVEGS